MCDKPKFTPGPWHVHRKEFHFKRGIDCVSESIHGENSTIGIIASMPFEREYSMLKEYRENFNQMEVDANAALIATAPEMYALLEKALEALEDDGYMDEESVRLRMDITNVLVRAKGEA